MTRKVLFLFLVFSSPCLGAERLSVPEQIRFSIEGRDLLLARDYEGTERFLAKLASDWPEELLGPFGWMAYYQVRNLENFDFRFDAPYKPWEEKGRTEALRILKDRKAATWDLLLAGGTLGLSGFYRAHHSRWFSALRDALNAIHALERSFAESPQRVEALLGLGLYDYWRSHFTRKLLFLPFFPDRREEGIWKLRRVIRGSEFGSVLAEISLAFIRFQEKKHPEVLETTGRLLKRLPKNTILRMLEGETLLALKRHRDAIASFEAILSADPSLTKSILLIGMALADEGKDPAKAAEFLEKFLEAEPKAPYLWRKPALERLKKMGKKL